MHDAPVFLISSGRSGSTLLQRLLNCHPDLVVWGEHHGFLNGLSYAFGQMGQKGNNNQFPILAALNAGPDTLLPTLGDASAGIDWANPYSREEFGDQVRQFMAHYFGSRLAPGQRWGFKEVRYNNLTALDAFRELYPRGQFIFLKRNPLEVARSKVLAWNGSKMKDMGLDERLEKIKRILAEVRGHFKLYDEFSARNPEVCVQVRYEDLVGNASEAVSQLLSQLRLPESAFDWGLSSQVFGQIVSSTRAESLLTEAALVLAETRD